MAAPVAIQAGAVDFAALSDALVADYDSRAMDAEPIASRDQVRLELEVRSSQRSVLQRTHLPRPRPVEPNSPRLPHRRTGPLWLLAQRLWYQDV